MRTFILFAMSLVFGFAKAQTNISRTFPVKGSQNVELKFDYPEVKISTWNKNEIQITGIVNINDNENNDAFKIVETKNGNTITARNAAIMTIDTAFVIDFFLLFMLPPQSSRTISAPSTLTNRNAIAATQSAMASTTTAP